MRILRTSQARKDLLDIWSHIAGNAEIYIADAYLARLEGVIEVLAFAPHIGRVRPEFRGKPRSMPVKPYVIFYEPLPEGDGILIWRVIHGMRDLGRIVRRPRR